MLLPFIQGKRKITSWAKMLKHLQEKNLPVKNCQTLTKQVQNLRQNDLFIEYIEQYTRFHIGTNL